MHQPSVKIVVNVDEKLFLKDPNSSELGLKIIEQSILMISNIGFESFTFRKLAKKIGVSEPSI